MCAKNGMKSHVSTSTPFGLYINKREGGGVCELLGRRGGSHGNVVLGPRVLNGEGFMRLWPCVCMCAYVCGCVQVCESHPGPMIVGAGSNDMHFSGLRFRPIIPMHKSGVHGLRRPLYSGRRN